MLYLASQSPRRRELLQQICVPFEPLTVDVDETVLANESPTDYVQRLALEKARAGVQQMSPHAWVLGADTSVVLEQQIFGKPSNAKDAMHMLQQLSGKTHQVMTAIALVSATQVLTRLNISAVQFRSLQMDEIERYIATGEPHDKAGAYAIQGLAAQFISHLSGSYSGVMGLPLYETAEILRHAGLISHA